MSTPDQPSTPPLTRRQLRELRNTASTPIITPEEAQADAEASHSAVDDAPVAEADHDDVIETERAPIAPAADADLDHDAHPVTRRQARHLAKLRTGTVDVIEAEFVTGEQPTVDAAESESAGEEGAQTESSDELEEVVVPVDDDEPVEADEPVEPDEPEEPAESEEPAEVDEPAQTDQADERVEDEHGGQPGAGEEPSAAHNVERTAEGEPARVVAPGLGAQLLADGAAPVDLPPSFDHLLTRGGSGSSSAPNALILSQSPETGSLSVPILGTGELIITGSYALPESYGSTGSAPGSSDGKDVDATLMDGELPLASSPTPIAASSAISTIKSADDIIRPPAPEKGSRLIMTLAICAGALGLALATVLILTLVNGSF